MGLGGGVGEGGCLTHRQVATLAQNMQTLVYKPAISRKPRSNTTCAQQMNRVQNNFRKNRNDFTGVKEKREAPAFVTAPGSVQRPVDPINYINTPEYYNSLLCAARQYPESDDKPQDLSSKSGSDDKNSPSEEKILNPRKKLLRKYEREAGMGSFEESESTREKEITQCLQSEHEDPSDTDGGRLVISEEAIPDDHVSVQLGADHVGGSYQHVIQSEECQYVQPEDMVIVNNQQNNVDCRLIVSQIDNVSDYMIVSSDMEFNNSEVVTLGDSQQKIVATENSGSRIAVDPSTQTYVYQLPDNAYIIQQEPAVGTTERTISPVAFQNGFILPQNAVLGGTERIVSPVQMLGGTERIVSPVQMVRAPERIVNPVQMARGAERIVRPAQMVRGAERIVSPVQLVRGAERIVSPVQNGHFMAESPVQNGHFMVVPSGFSCVSPPEDNAECLKRVSPVTVSTPNGLYLKDSIAKQLNKVCSGKLTPPGVVPEVKEYIPVIKLEDIKKEPEEVLPDTTYIPPVITVDNIKLEKDDSEIGENKRKCEVIEEDEFRAEKRRRMEKELEIIHIIHAAKKNITEVEIEDEPGSREETLVRKKDDIRKRNNEASKTYRANKRNKINCMQDELKELKDKNNSLQNEASLAEMQVHTMKKLVHEMYKMKN